MVGQASLYAMSLDFVVGYLLVVAGCWLLVVGCCLLVMLVLPSFLTDTLQWQVCLVNIKGGKILYVDG